jgi:hypothetical protein
VRRWEDALWHAHEALKAAPPAPTPAPGGDTAAQIAALTQALEEQRAGRALAEAQIAKIRAALG